MFGGVYGEAGDPDAAVGPIASLFAGRTGGDAAPVRFAKTST